MDGNLCYHRFGDKNIFSKCDHLESLTTSSHIILDESCGTGGPQKSDC